VGAAFGNQNARKRHWTTAIEAAVMVEDPATKRRRLHAIADRLVQMAESGDIQAMKEIGDRLDGKASQTVDLIAEITNHAAQLSDEKLAEIAANASNRDQT
jgi:alkylhydroperoxidase family enzyme